MRIGITGTYSSGKTTTTIALSNLTGIPRTSAATMREILPTAIPGKKLSQCTSAEYIHLVVRRHVERVVHQTTLGDNFISDGCSLQEWSYGISRVGFGMNPTQDDKFNRPLEDSTERSFYFDIFNQLGAAFFDYVRSSFDVFLHLQNEFPIVNDGHRPMNDQFRQHAERLILDKLSETGLPMIFVSGSIEKRLETIVNTLELPTKISINEAVKQSKEEYQNIDQRLELERQ